MITKRSEIFQNASNTNWDVIIIGGGATGLGIAVDSANRGLKTLLLEQYDYAKATSSRSTKLVHGGVRYLQQGDILLVREALVERGRMLRNAPHLVEDMRFIIGQYRWWERIFYTIGLTFYDLLAGSLGFGRSLPLSKEKVLEELPGLERELLKGGVVYHDGQFDDSRMAITLMLSAQDAGATCLNYAKVTSLLKDSSGKISAVKVNNQLDEEACDYQISGKLVINATGVFVDDVMIMDAPESSRKVRPSQGIHLVVDSEFLGTTQAALMIPKTLDGRVLFGVPWHGKVILGTTDTLVDYENLEPRALESEVDFVLEEAGKYLEKKPTRQDVLCVFAGLRPLAAPQGEDTKKTKEISRSHKIYKSQSGLWSITGGKWTTYRAMAEDILNKALNDKKIPAGECITQDLKLHGYSTNVDRNGWDYVYGSDVRKIDKIIQENPDAGELLHPDFTFKKAHVIFAARNEQAQTVEDVLARRVRALFLNARASKDMAETVARILAKELGKDEGWIQYQIQTYSMLADGYIL